MSTGFFGKLFGKKEEDSSEFIWIYSQCDKCGEKFRTKELIGASCPNRINLHLEFDRSYRKISEEISGGHFITKDEYQS